ncbi:hypothetical protein B0H13DRAFT_289259 [Mycena leptocephala]|nr:hypothetical protein B0H13DRAFT_289259 [Mycena leptocephala]
MPAHHPPPHRTPLRPRAPPRICAPAHSTQAAGGSHRAYPPLSLRFTPSPRSLLRRMRTDGLLALRPHPCTDCRHPRGAQERLRCRCRRPAQAQAHVDRRLTLDVSLGLLAPLEDGRHKSSSSSPSAGLPYRWCGVAEAWRRLYSTSLEKARLHNDSTAPPRSCGGIEVLSDFVMLLALLLSCWTSTIPSARRTRRRRRAVRRLQHCGPGRRLSWGELPKRCLVHRALARVVSARAGGRRMRLSDAAVSPV